MEPYILLGTVALGLVVMVATALFFDRKEHR